MNVTTTVNKYKPTLMAAIVVPEGVVYSWGAKSFSYLRVDGGSVCLSTWEFLSESTQHFSLAGPRVEVAQKADLTITYEG